MSADCVSSPAQSYNLCWPEKLPRLTMAAGTVPMKRINSGSQGLEVSVQGLGCMSMSVGWSDPGGPGMWKKRLSLRAGTTKIENFNQNIGPFSLELTPEEMSELESIAAAEALKGDRYGEGILTLKNSDTPPLSWWKPNGE
ncbi:unnamed protein product [Linum tenue]|uniref:Uncharacterized protein n=1 Tax=Linum tenue TaxID=586396 RepID=A0AAV0N3R6_9ROSI|nr:unnamed protein product [Linum tenue]